MKKSSLAICIFLSLLFASAKNLKAQYTEEEIVKKGYTTDGIINILIDYLPKGWNFKEENSNFIFQRNDSIWELTENTLNVPIEKKDEKNKRIISNGKKTVSKIVIRYEDKWNFLKIQEATLLNQNTYNEIRLLPEKYNITALKDSKLSSKSHIVYTPKTESDKKRISDYNIEKEKLKGKIIKLPEMSSQKYSLFIEIKSGCNDEAHLVYPDEASVELYSILSFLREVCGK